MKRGFDGEFGFYVFHILKDSTREGGCPSLDSMRSRLVRPDSLYHIRSGSGSVAVLSLAVRVPVCIGRSRKADTMRTSAHTREEQRMDESYFEHRASFRSAGELLNLKFHRSEEETARDWLRRPLSQPSPVIYVHARPYVFRENLVLTIQLEPRNDPDEGSIGEVAGSRYEKPSEQEIGNAQAWLFPEQSKALLWECYLFRDFRV